MMRTTSPLIVNPSCGPQPNVLDEEVPAFVNELGAVLGRGMTDR